MRKLTEPPIISTCPVGGEEWPTESYKSVIDVYADPFQYCNAHFTCPAGHGFTLSKAVRSKMFTRAQADRMVELAKEEIARHMKRVEGLFKGGKP